MSIEGVCEDPDRLRSSFEFENSRSSLSLHVAQGWIVPNEQGGGAVAFIVQADMVHFDADKEIFEVENKIAALEAQSANVHDESNAQKVGTKGAASVPEESSGSQVGTVRACERVAEAMLEDPRQRKRKRRGRIREVTRTLKKGPEGCRIRRLMHDGEVWFIQGEIVEEVEPMDRLSRLTDAELTTQVRIGE